MSWTTIILLIIATSLLAAVIWHRIRAYFSKARVALAVLGSAVTVFTAGLTAATAGLLHLLLQAALQKIGIEVSLVPSEISSIATLLIAAFVSWRILRFGERIISTWDGPPRVSERELAKSMLQDNLFALAAYDLKLLIKERGQDPLATREEVDWRSDRRDPPVRDDDPLFLRSLFLATFSEAEFSDDGWRAELQVWCGSLATNPKSEANDALLIIFDNQPSHTELSARLAQCKRLIRSEVVTRVFAVFPNGGGSGLVDETITCNSISTRLICSRFLLEEALQLRKYAGQLQKRYVDERAG